MKTDRPNKLISLLENLLASSEKSSAVEIFKEISKEAQSIRFYETQETLFLGLLYKNMARLSSKEFIETNFSDQSKKDIEDLIKSLNNSEIFA